MSKLLRGFQVIRQDGSYTINSTYHELDSAGNITKKNAKDSFYANDSEVLEHLAALEAYIIANRLS